MRISDWSSDVCSSDLQGVADVNIHLAGVTLGGGAANDIAGRAVIVPAAPDDYTSQPSGNAGARVACGVINAAMCRPVGSGRGDRKSGVWGKRVAVRFDRAGRRLIKQKKTQNNT